MGTFDRRRPRRAKTHDVELFAQGVFNPGELLRRDGS
jgi:hypothetical protein